MAKNGATQLGARVGSSCSTDKLGLSNRRRGYRYIGELCLYILRF